MKKAIEVLVKAMLLGLGKPLNLTVPMIVTFGGTNAASGQPSVLLVLPLVENSLRNRVSEAEGDEVGRAVLPPVRQVALIDSDGVLFVERDKVRTRVGHRRRTEFIPFSSFWDTGGSRYYSGMHDTTE